MTIDSVTLTKEECEVLYRYFSTTYITKSPKQGIHAVFKKIADCANSHEPRVGDSRQISLLDGLAASETPEA